MRPKVSLERFDPATGWPIEVYLGFVDAERAGFNRGAIHQVLRGQRGTAGGFGWRPADACSRLPEFVRLWCHAGEAVSFHEFAARFSDWAGSPVDSVRLRRLIQGRYALAWIDTPAVVCRATGQAVAGKDEVIQGLAWAA